MKKIAQVMVGKPPKADPVPPPAAEKPPAEIPDQDVVQRNAARDVSRRRSTGRAATLLADDEGSLG